MKKLLKLILVGVLAGIILANILVILHILMNNPAYILLFNVDYIPILKNLRPESIIGVIFHFSFCIVSVVGLFYLLKIIHRERQTLLYVVVYAGGSSILYFLTIFSGKPPFATDITAWMYWTLAHAIYGLVVGEFVKRWI